MMCNNNKYDKNYQLQLLTQKKHQLKKSLPQIEVNSIPSCGYSPAKFLSSDHRRQKTIRILPLNNVNAEQCYSDLKGTGMHDTHML